MGASGIVLLDGNEDAVEGSEVYSDGDGDGDGEIDGVVTGGEKVSTRRDLQ